MSIWEVRDHIYRDVFPVSTRNWVWVEWRGTHLSVYFGSLARDTALDVLLYINPKLSPPVRVLY